VIVKVIVEKERECRLAGETEVQNDLMLQPTTNFIQNINETTS
jgi:hypothetical protein